MSASWIGSETSGRARSSSIRARSPRPESHAFSAAAVSRRARSSSPAVRAAARSRAQRRGGEAASLPCALRGLLELLADRGVGLAGRRRAVPGAAIGLGLPVEHARERTMGSLPLRQRSGLVDGGAHERVAKLEPRAAHVHQACLLGVIERVRRRAEGCSSA